MISRVKRAVARLLPSNVVVPKVIILGNQKSGTSAIAHLLADLGGLSKRVDIPCLWAPRMVDLLQNKVTLSQVIDSDPRQFSFNVLKEPNLSFVASQVAHCFPESQLLFVIRDPRANIKSILDRLGVTPSSGPFDIRSLPPLWQHVFQREVWGFPSDDSVSILAHRWTLAVDNALALKGRVRIVRYEDFQDSKQEFIERIAAECGIEPMHDIRSRLDIQYQPKGNHGVSARQSLGESAVKMIESICEPQMKQFQYHDLA